MTRNELYLKEIKKNGRIEVAIDRILREQRHHSKAQLSMMKWKVGTKVMCEVHRRADRCYLGI